MTHLRVMMSKHEADIAAKAVELGTNTDFSLFSLFYRSGHNC